MIWLTWRQFRTQAALAVGALVVVGLVLAITGSHLMDVYSSTVVNCQAHNDCPAAVEAFSTTYRELQGWLGALMYVVPALVGIFWGAPLVARELESGTFRMAWTQTVTRTRWLIAKLALVGFAAIAAAGIFSLMVTWWSSRLDLVSMSRFETFDTRGVVPIGYAAVAPGDGGHDGGLHRHQDGGGQMDPTTPVRAAASGQRTRPFVDGLRQHGRRPDGTPAGRVHLERVDQLDQDRRRSRS
jgi:hypothetical protein